MDATLRSAIQARPGLAEYYAGRPVLVLGGLGFVGSNLARTLLVLGANVTVVDNLAAGCGGTRANLADVAERVEIITGDAGDVALLGGLAPRFDSVFNVVGRVSHVDSMSDPLSDLYTNVTAQIGILEAFRRNNAKAKIVHAGSRSQYGRTDGTPTRETALPSPVDVNGVHKQAGEQLHFVYASAFGLRAASLRLTNTYGPRMTLRAPGNGVLPWFVRQALEDHEIHLYGGGHQKRDCVFIDDAVLAFLLAMRDERADGQTYNIGATPVSLIEVSQLIVAAAGRGRIVDHPYPPEHKAVEVGDFVADNAKAEAELGWRAQTPIAEGLRRSVAFYVEHGLATWCSTGS
jgi:nucleoside-diphosphate-sugar epimerase